MSEEIINIEYIQVNEAPILWPIQKSLFNKGFERANCKNVYTYISIKRVMLVM